MQQIYKIKKGDTLTGIAKEFGTTVDQLVKDNNLKNANLIFVDQELAINTGNGGESSSTEEMNFDEIIAANTGETVQEVAPEPTPEPTEEVKSVTENITNTVGNVEYTGELRSKKSASDSARATNGVVTSGNKMYTVGDVTSGNTISMSDYYYLVGQVAGESGNDSDDMLGVTSTILNRLEGGGQDVKQVLQTGYWPWGKTCDRFLNYDANGNPVGFKTIEQIGPAEYQKLELVKQVVADSMNGIRNLDSNTIFYSGDGKHNYFSDHV